MVLHHGPARTLIPHLPYPSRSSSRRIQQRQQFPSADTVTLANHTITALTQVSSSYSNHLFGLSSVTNAPATATPLSSSTSNRLGHRIYSACDRYRRQLLCGIRTTNDDPSVNINLSLDHHEHSSLFPSIDYATPVIARTIKAELVSLPAVAGTAELSATLPPHLSSFSAIAITSTCSGCEACASCFLM